MGDAGLAGLAGLDDAVRRLRREGGDPSSLGAVLEGLHDGAGRGSRGLWVTPPAVADAVVGWAFDAVTAGPVRRVCDPAVGAGAFLLAAARRLRRDGWAVPDVLGALHGVDTDPLAVAACTAALELWAVGEGVAATVPPGRIVVGDGLAQPFGGGFDVVVGNPPFLGQLQRSTVRSRSSAAALRRGSAMPPPATPTPPHSSS